MASMLDMIKALTENDGLTLKEGKPISYLNGWQVADYGKEAHTPEECEELVKEFNGDCGIWLEKGIYYVDHSFWVRSKKRALKIGNRHNQISVFGWKNSELAYCKGK